MRGWGDVGQDATLGVGGPGPCREPQQCRLAGCEGEGQAPAAVGGVVDCLVQDCIAWPVACGALVHVMIVVMGLGEGNWCTRTHNVACAHVCATCSCHIFTATTTAVNTVHQQSTLHDTPSSTHLPHSSECPHCACAAGSSAALCVTSTAPSGPLTSDMRSRSSTRKPSQGFTAAASTTSTPSAAVQST